MDIMIDRIDSISNGTRKLSERIHIVEFDIRKLSKSFDKLTDRLYLQDDNLHDIQEKSKEETLSLKENTKTGAE